MNDLEDYPKFKKRRLGVITVKNFVIRKKKPLSYLTEND